MTIALLTTPALSQSIIHVPADQPTIQAAINAAQNGDTVLVAPGTYNENIDFKGKAIAVTSGAKSFADASSTIINGVGNGPIVVFKTNETAASVFNGFTVEHGDSTVLYLNGTSATISNNIITNNNACAVVVSGLTANPVITGNEISHTNADYGLLDCGVQPTKYVGSPPQGTAISLLEAGSVQIIGNTLEDNGSFDSSTGMFNGGGIFTHTSTKVLLENNIIRNNMGTAIYVFNNAQTFLVQNLVYGNKSKDSAVKVGAGIAFLPPGTPSTFALWVTNNTIYGNTEDGSGSGNLNGSQGSFHGAFAQNTIANNLFISADDTPAVDCLPRDALGSSYPFVFINNDSLNTGQLQPNSCVSSGSSPTNLAVDPQFLNPAAGDFHTQRTSPVVAAGDINAPSIPPADLDNKARTVCGTIDMGVYEIRPIPPITLTGSPQTAPGQSTVTFTAAVAGNCNIPTGVVTFLDGAATLGTAPLNSSGVATFDTSFLFVGAHPITATYPGDFNFDASTSNTITEIITGPPTATVLNTVSPNPVRPLQPITMTATVTSAFTTPTGSITFMANGAVLATVPATPAGAALATVSNLHPGTYNITAVYGGSTEYAASTSNTIVETVLGANTATTLTASPNPALPAQTVTLAATISGSQTGIPLTGTVTFKDGANTLGSAAVGANGTAIFSTSALLTGTHPITATYSGSSDYNASLSNTVNEIVTAIPTSIGLNVSPNPATVGQNVIITATAISNPPNQTPTGSITFSDPSAQSGTLGAAPLVAGVASFNTTTLTAGTHQITATLNPTGSFAPSTATVSELITAFDFALSASATSLTIPGNAYQVLSVTITPSGGFPRAVNLTCSQAPLYAECVFDKSTTDPLSKGPQTIKLTVSTSSVFRYGKQVGTLSPNPVSLKYNAAIVCGFFLPVLLLGGLTGKLPRCFSNHRHRLFLLLAVAACVISLQGCSGQLPRGTPAGDYTLTVTASDTAPGTALAHSVTLNLHVPQ